MDCSSKIQFTYFYNLFKMKQIVQVIFTSIAILLMTKVEAQDAIYVHHDEAYMDKYQYKVENLSSYDYHMAYHIYTSATEKIILNISMNSYRAVSTTTLKKTKEIKEINWNTSLIHEINNNLTNLHLVFKEGNTNQQYKVSSAIYVQESENKLMYAGPYYSYTFDKKKTYNPAEDLEAGKFPIYDEAIYMHSADVDDIRCIKQFSFIKIIKQTHPKNSFTMIANDDFTKLKTSEIYETSQSALSIDYLENIGIVEERTKNGSIKLMAINNQRIEDYITLLCQPKTTETNSTNNSGLNFKTREDNTEKSGALTLNIPEEYGNETSTNTSKNEPEYELIYTMIDDEIIPPILKAKVISDSKGATNVHIVDNGETLYSISRKYNISVKELQTLNNIGDEGIYVTQKIILSKTSQIPNTYGVPTITSTNKPSLIHVVDNGETLYSIARKYAVSVKDLENLNNIPETGIFVTQELIIK